jgi:RND family efflux transporter MFP subunit
VLAHELAHIRRRDNLTAALHMLVEAIFWFHPIVWWIGAQLLAERERACDEAVLSLGNQPRVYAEAILSVCKLYTESPLTCVSGVTGNSLNTRVRAILSQRLAGDMTMIKKTALTLFGIAALILPVLIGMIAAHPAHAQLQTVANPSFPSAQPPSRPAAAIAGGRGHGSLSTLPYLPALGSVNAVSATVTAQVDGQLTSLNFTEGELVKQGQLLASIDVATLRLQVERAQAHLDSDKKRLDDTRKSPTSPEQRDSLDQLQISIQADQAELQDAQSRLQAGQVVAPITGVAGFHLIDRGNFVHTGDRLAVINQLQPISATFNMGEDYVSEVVGALKNGSSPKVELWNRDDSTRIAIGNLAAIDNQIDPATGMVKLRALFENKDGALFPNEFVNVHLFLNTR